jgi:hypothetical protein
LCRIWRDDCVRSRRTRGVSLPAEWGVGQTAGAMSQKSYSKGGANYRQRGFSASSLWCAAYRCIYSNVETGCAALAQNGPLRTKIVKMHAGVYQARGCIHGRKRGFPAGNCGRFAVYRLALGMARYLHYSCTTPSQGALSRAHPRQVWKAPRMTGLDSVVLPAPGTTGLRATVAAHGVSLSPSAHRLPDPLLTSGRLIPR